MENKEELEKLVQNWLEDRAGYDGIDASDLTFVELDGCFDLTDFVDIISNFAYKQGYMQGCEQGKQVGAANEMAKNLINSLHEIDPELLKHHPEYQELRDQLKALQEQLQAHDAITKKINEL